MFKININMAKREVLLKSTNKNIGYHFLCCLVIISFLQLSCENDRNMRGYEYFKDMVYSKSYETYDANNIFPDGKTAQPPVLGSIPRHMVPFQYPKTSKGLKLAGKELINPFEVNAINLSRGEVEYNVFCANCHGFDGKGDGNLYASGKYPSEPPSLITNEMLEKPDGEFYHTITLGSGIMGSFASLIRPQDKWKIILYIKNKLPKKELNRK